VGGRADRPGIAVGGITLKGHAGRAERWCTRRFPMGATGGAGARRCPHCDEEIGADAARCPYCAEPVGEERATTIPPDSATQRVPVAATRAGGPRRQALVALVLLVGVGVLGGLGYLAATRADRGSNTEPREPEPPGPQGVSVRAHPFKVRLSWLPPQETDVKWYVVKRGGLTLALVGRGTSWIDRTVLPGKSYSYSIAAVLPDGAESEPVLVSVHTPRVPPGEARIQGTYEFGMTPSNQFGYIDPYEGRWWFYIKFTPVCGNKGPCKVIRFRMVDEDIAGVLRRSGRQYVGSADGYWGTTCGSRAALSQFTLAVEIARSIPDNAADALVATRLVGVLSVYEPPQFTCRASGVTFTGVGKPWS